MDSILPVFTSLILVMFIGCFVKMATALSIFKQSLGLSGAAISLVVVGVSIVLSLLVLDSKVGLDRPGFNAEVAEKEQVIPFFEKYTDPLTKDRIFKLGERLQAESQTTAGVEPDNSRIVAAAFLVSELKTAFKIGLAILIPFLVIDLVVAQIMILLGVTQYSGFLFALPLKLLLFISIDGWELLTEKLFQGYI